MSERGRGRERVNLCFDLCSFQSEIHVPVYACMCMNARVCGMCTNACVCVACVQTCEYVCMCDSSDIKDTRTMNFSQSLFR